MMLNAQGDVICLLDSTGATVASYEYDPFGNIITATGAMAEANPLRYRGYYYDRETGFYYLNSRYYDPKIGRFINADSYVSTGQGIVGYNMFAYCGNNPVNASDPMGDFWLWDFLDIHFAAESWTEFVFDPSWEGFGYAFLDTLGAMPLVPSYSTVNTGANIAEVAIKPSSKVLRNNMIKAGVEVPDYANAAHHIVAGTAKKASDARAILSKYKVGINDASNGVFLPTVKGVSEAAYHPGLHTNAYYDKVNDLLNKAKSKQEVIDILKYISGCLENGTFLK